MEILPAIDVISGRCVRLSRGDYASKKVYTQDPLAQAQLYEENGLKNLHLVDLEGAKAGEVVNWPSIEKIAANTNLFLEVGGGVRTVADIEKLLGLGVDRVLIGSIALKNTALLKEFLSRFGQDKIVVDVAVKKGDVYCHGWQERTHKLVDEFLGELIGLGVGLILCTDIERDGTLQGPNILLYRQLMEGSPSLKIIASGGIASAQDLKKLFELGVYGAVVGKAIYENKISLEELRAFV